MGAVPGMREEAKRPTSSPEHGASRSERDRQPTEPKAMEGRLTASVSTPPDDRLRPTAGTGVAGGAAMYEGAGRFASVATERAAHGPVHERGAKPRGPSCLRRSATPLLLGAVLLSRRPVDFFG